MLSLISFANEAIALEDAPASPAREIAILRSKAVPLVFAIAPFRQCQSLIRRLNAEVAQCVYLLVGEVDGQPVAREGRTGGPIARFGMHLSNPEFQHFTDVAVIAGPRLTESAVKALECLVARQIAAVGAVRHQSKGAELVNVSAGAWNSALDAFLFFRYAARTMGINFLEPEFAAARRRLLELRVWRSRSLGAGRLRIPKGPDRKKEPDKRAASRTHPRRLRRDRGAAGRNLLAPGRFRNPSDSGFVRAQVGLDREA